MNLNFYKYQGAGNDFIFIDNRNESFPKDNKDLIIDLCDRHFGIGADGLILIENDPELDFKMVYFNSDSSQTMCGNGARCAVAFSNHLDIIQNQTKFMAYDGPHEAMINEDGTVSLGMIDVNEIDVQEDHVFTNTGTLHHVEMVMNLSEFPVFEKGRKIRNEKYGTEGSNINFVEQSSQDTFRIRTYERGVEDETLACGTGVTAAAIAMHKTGKTDSQKVYIQAEGGDLNVTFKEENGVYTNVVLTGPAELVFKGNLEI